VFSAFAGRGGPGFGILPGTGSLGGGTGVRERRLRVLHVVKGLGPGGAERLLCSAAAVRDREIFDYDVAYVLPWKEHLVPELTRSGVAVHCLSPEERTAPGRTARILLDPRWTARLARLLRTRPYDIVHLHSPLIAGVVRPMVRSLGHRRAKLVSTEHNGWSTYALPTRLINGLTYPLDDARFAVSEEVRDSVSPRLRERVEVAVHGLPLDDVRALRAERAAVRAELGLAADDVVVGTVANYRAQKAYPDLLAAARTAVGADPRVRFVAVGQGPLEAEIQREHARLGLGERFALLGYRPDAARVLAGCDVFALASHYEGFPVALMEALALGLPVVATAVGGIPDGVTDGREGLLVPAGSPDRLADAVLRLAADDRLRSRMAAAAARRGGDFDIRRAVRRMEAVYLALVRGSAPEPLVRQGSTPCAE
jgi:glycosyltransferase involved in cell wall biosynthesis